MQILPENWSAHTKQRSLIIVFMTITAIAFVLIYTGILQISLNTLADYNDSTNTWLTILAYVQIIFLIGTSYAYFLIKKLSSKWQLIINCSCLFLSLWFLPFPSELTWYFNNLPPAINILISLFFQTGPPFIMLAATCILLQNWFSKSLHAKAKDPYFLLGRASLIVAIIAFFYLLLLQIISLDGASLFWFILYILLLISLGCALLVVKLIQFNQIQYKKFKTKQKLDNATQKQALLLSWHTKAYLVAANAIATCLLLSASSSFTAHLPNFIFLIAIPLLLLLLAVFLSFNNQHWLTAKKVALIQFICLFPFILTFYFQAGYFWINKIIQLATYFVSLLICFKQIYHRRPPVQLLPEYYGWLAIGGLLGGFLVLLLAPMISIPDVIFPLSIAASCLFRPCMGHLKFKNVSSIDFILPVLSIILIYLLGRTLQLNYTQSLNGIFVVIIFSLCLIFFAYPEYRYRFSLGIAALIMGATFGLNPWGQQTLLTQHDFYGTTRVIYASHPNRHLLISGDRIVGSQYYGQQLANKSMKYISLCANTNAAEEAAIATVTSLYNHNTANNYTPLQMIINNLTSTNYSLRAAIIGIGTGNVSCLARPQDQFDFFDNRTSFLQIATNPQFFNYIHQCPAHAIYLGNPRLRLSQIANGSYQLILLDSTSFENLPIHWLTQEAIQLYINKLTQQGLLAIEINSDHTNLIDMFSAVANQLGLSARIYINQVSTSNSPLASSPVWLVMARSDAALNHLANNADWQRLPTVDNSQAWLDQQTTPSGIS